MLVRTLIAITLGTLFVACSDKKDSTDSGNKEFPLVSVGVKDAPFDRPPDSVTIFSKAPRETFPSMPLMIDADPVRLFQAQGVFYCVGDVDFHNERLGTSFADGDVVYIYDCDSLLAEDQLLRNHGFTRVNDADKYHGLYQIRPHVFVRIGTNRDAAHFSCSMHPQVKAASKRDCPICDMDLLAIAPQDEEAEQGADDQTPPAVID